MGVCFSNTGEVERWRSRLPPLLQLRFRRFNGTPVNSGGGEFVGAVKSSVPFGPSATWDALRPKLVVVVRQNSVGIGFNVNSAAWGGSRFSVWDLTLLRFAPGGPRIGSARPGIGPRAHG